MIFLDYVLIFLDYVYEIPDYVYDFLEKHSSFARHFGAGDLLVGEADASVAMVVAKSLKGLSHIVVAGRVGMV